MISPELRHHLGSLVTDIGKYMLTAFAFGYLLNQGSSSEMMFLVVIVLLGILFCTVGIALTVVAEKALKKEREQKRKHGKKTIKLLKNTTLVVEED